MFLSHTVFFRHTPDTSFKDLVLLSVPHASNTMLSTCSLQAATAADANKPCGSLLQKETKSAISKDEPCEPAAEPSFAMLVLTVLLPVLLLGCVGVLLPHSAIWGSAAPTPPPPAHIPAAPNTMTVGLSLNFPTALVVTWLLYISIAAVLQFVIAKSTAVRFVMGVAACWFAAPPVAGYLGAVLNAALGLFAGLSVGKLWTAAVLLCKVAMAAVVASAALSGIVQVSPSQQWCPDAMP